MSALLLSTYELGRQPFGLASAAAWMRDAGFTVLTQDLSQERLDQAAARDAEFIGLYLPMHTATRITLALLPKIRSLNPNAHLAAFGLYASMNETALRAAGVRTLISGEFEAALVEAAKTFHNGDAETRRSEADQGFPTQAKGELEWGTSTGPLDLHPEQGEGALQDANVAATVGLPRRCAPRDVRIRSLVVLPRLQFQIPDRAGFPPLQKYARLQLPDGTRRLAGSTEASRGCKHVCRHCPIVPVYEGAFRVVQRDVVLEDIRRQVAMGAEHMTFGDPDFFNGPAHAMEIARTLHREFPALTYDVTIKIEHLLRHDKLLAELRATGCAFVTSAVESFDDRVLALLLKGHTRADFERCVRRMRDVGLPLAPTFIPFTPWTTAESYVEFLETIAAMDLVEHVSPVQLAIRLLIPAGSKLLDVEEVRNLIGDFDAARLSYMWATSDERVDALQHEIEALIERMTMRSEQRSAVFAAVYELARRALGDDRAPDLPVLQARAAIPFLTEPWYC